MRLAVSLDVPSLARGLAFYNAALGFTELSRPRPNLLLIGAGEVRILLIERPEGSLPHPEPALPRRYSRHWTPVHLDFHLTDVAAARDRAVAAGATCEAWHHGPGHPPAAFMADPFGHGFCLIGETAQA